ncbi:MAG: Aminotransferase, DegT/DnrJ/EryC1/StrS family [Nitrospira sp.]|jgi:dTDP-4-amino-4,6-dideoxygalactose transaminase|nr:MAG: Aminotransferase, DegT/DnrJ/EryC1/StrS family [Nitrospira sp.]
MGVPLLDLRAHHAPLYDQLLAAIDQVLRSQSFILGPEVSKLEERVASYCQARFGIGVSSGTDALLVALMAIEIGPGDEVITTPYSFFATAGAITRLGARPIFVDIDPITFNIDPAKIERTITKKTRAIIPVHLYGQCADMEPILRIAQNHGLKVIEDGAQAIGADYRDGRRACSMGTVGCLSFFPSKNLGALGDGGMVVTNDPEIADRIKVLRVHGGKPKYYHKFIGGNFRLDTLQAAVLNVKLDCLDDWTRRRQENAQRYEALVSERGLLENPEIRLPEPVYRAHGVRHYHIYNQFVLRVPRRDELMAFLKQKGIGTEVYYPVPFHLQECFRYLGYRAGDFPESERAAKETVALPIYPELTAVQQSEVVDAIHAFYMGKPA